MFRRMENHVGASFVERPTWRPLGGGCTPIWIEFALEVAIEPLLRATPMLPGPPCAGAPRPSPGGRR